MRIDRGTTPNYVIGRGRHKPEAIIVHTTAGTYEGTLAWFANAHSSVSAHYVVALNGRVTQLVNEADTARHAGRLRNPTATVALAGMVNERTIGIEFEDDGCPDDVVRTDAQYAAGARLLRDIARRWDIPLDSDHVVGHREVFSAKACPGNLDVPRLIAMAARPRLVCLLPVRNGAVDLPGWLQSVQRFADAVVALDDGSTDSTQAILQENPLVEVVLRNSPRATSAGWDDRSNRARLLHAAGATDPDWVVWLDADERLAPDDGAMLRAFVDSNDILAACAYGFRHYRMWGELADPQWSIVYRLFAYRPGQRLPGERLHFIPVPTDIPSGAFVATTIRLQHYGSANPERLQLRHDRYRQADPDGHYPTHFGRLCDIPKLTEPWRPRSSLSVLELLTG